MANIPVERDTGRPWWIWLLGLLLLALLIWLIAELLSGEPDADDELLVDDPVEEVTPVAPVETGMDLSDVYVTRVTGDRTFYVAPSETQTDMETLVILDQAMSPGAPGIEGQVDINDGQRVDLSDGRMEPLGDEDLLDQELTDTEMNAMTATTEVIRIDGGDVEILSAPMGVDEVEVGE
jgi:hypothetical protein